MSNPRVPFQTLAIGAQAWGHFTHEMHESYFGWCYLSFLSGFVHRIVLVPLRVSLVDDMQLGLVMCIVHAIKCQAKGCKPTTWVECLEGGATLHLT